MKKKILAKVSNSTTVVRVLPAISNEDVPDVSKIVENGTETDSTTKVLIHKLTSKAEAAPEIFESSDPPNSRTTGRNGIAWRMFSIASWDYFI